MVAVSRRWKHTEHSRCLHRMRPLRINSRIAFSTSYRSTPREAAAQNSQAEL